MAKVIVLGGAGYIGRHAALAYESAGHEVVLVDEFDAAKAETAKSSRVHRASLNDHAAIKSILRSECAELVVHCANARARALRADPTEAHRVHIGAALALMEAMMNCETQKLVLASSCETYGRPQTLPVMEHHPQHPSEPHAWSMFIAESIVRDLALANGVNFTILRFYIAVGAAPGLSDGAEAFAPLNPLPAMLDVLMGEADAYDLGGVEYDTRDGTLERELLHVGDIASACQLAGERLLAGSDPLICNLGRGRGVTLKDMLVMLRRVSGRGVNVVDGVSDPDQSAQLFADGHLAQKELGWKPKIGVEAAIRSAFEARQRKVGSR